MMLTILHGLQCLLNLLGFISPICRLSSSSVTVSLSDIEDGKTTSPQSLPFKPLNQPTTSSTSSQPQSLTLDRSKSAPASINQGASQIEIPTSIESSPLQPLKVGEPSPDPSDDTFRSQSQGLADSTSSCLQTDAHAPIPRTLPSQEPFSSTVPEDNKVTGDIISGDSGSLMDTVLGKNIISSGTVAAESPFIIFNPGSQTLTLDQEVDMDVSSNAKPETCQDFPDQFQRDQGSVIEDVSGAQPQCMPVPDLSLEPCPAEPATTSVNSDTEKSVIPCERDQPELDNIPSLAQALKELHNLLMSSSWPTVSGMNPLSDPNATTSRQYVDEVDQDHAARNRATLNPTIDTSSNTATTKDKEGSVAKAEFTSQSVRDSLDVPSNPRHTENQASTLVDPIVEQTIQHPYAAERNCALVIEEGSRLGTASSQGDLELPEGQQVQDIADENPSGIDISADLSQQRPLSVAAGISTNSSQGPSPQTQATATDPLFLGDQLASQASMGQFPLEHIQRIQASGFSAREAAEALEQAQGSVELALLVLLARKITVPI